MSEVSTQSIEQSPSEPKDQDTEKSPGEVSPLMRRLFSVTPASNEKALEKVLNDNEEAGFLLGDVIPKPTGGFIVLAWRPIPVITEAPAPVNNTEGEPITHEGTETSFQGDPPETI